MNVTSGTGGEGMCPPPAAALYRMHMYCMVAIMTKRLSHLLTLTHSLTHSVGRHGTCLTPLATWVWVSEWVRKLLTLSFGRSVRWQDGLWGLKEPCSLARSLARFLAAAKEKKRPKKGHRTERSKAKGKKAALRRERRKTLSEVRTVLLLQGR